VFVERKTHRESWKGEESVKERIVLPEENVVPFLEQTYTVEQAVDDLRAKVGAENTLRAGGDRADVNFCHVAANV
jgi:SPX domain protein involved in polyphosphate accumulation